MNSVPNSDSEQCTESKLSRVHSAPTLSPAYALIAPCHKPGPAVSQAWPDRVAGAPYRVAAPMGALERHVAGRVLLTVLQASSAVSRAYRACRNAPVLCRRVLASYRSPSALYRNTRSTLLIMIQSIVS